MHNQLREIEFFVAVAHHLSYRGAANELLVSQPAVSRGIAQLETRLRTRLFHRTTRLVSLTSTGAMLLEAAEEMLDAARRFDVRAQALREGLHGPVRIGVPPNVDPVLLARVLALISTSHPHVEFLTRERNTAKQVEMLRDGELDVGFLRHPFDAAGLVTREVGSEALMVALPERHPLSARDVVALTDLVGEPLITYLASDFVTALLDSCRRGGYAPPERIEASQLATQHALVSAGRGVALVPARFVESGSGIVLRPLLGSPIIMRTAAAWVEKAIRPVTRQLTHAISVAAANGGLRL